ncbi:hypothetical protein [Stenotrophomonas maltophilia]|uniref:hypothetical protein n=1 Tax=Stenotrophomonas maltophilia TaxID=40324 RepID=UPI0013D916D9|nr:hypothetical protein [Stenotrophomonas maltophilia]
MERAPLRRFSRPALLLGALFAASSVQDAHAAGVLVCDNCRDPRALALYSGTGPTIVVDFQQRRLHGFDVEYDRELRRYRATRAQIPGPINASFNRIMGMLDNNVPTVQFAPRQWAGRGVQYEVHPDDPQYANGIGFPEEHKNLNAYDVVQMATERFRLESAMGKAFTGATTSSRAWNSMATFLSSIGLSFVSKALGIDGAIYRITWRDGSKTTLAIVSSSVDTARYVQGQSKDANGNMIPDGAATSPGVAQHFAGTYNFNSRDDLDRWIDSGRLYGVNMFPGAPPESLQIVCEWNGTDIVCRLPR